MLRHHLINIQWLFAMDIIIQRAVMNAVITLISGKCLLLSQGLLQAMEKTRNVCPLCLTIVLSFPSWLYFLAIKQYCHKPFGAKILILNNFSCAVFLCLTETKLMI